MFTPRIYYPHPFSIGDEIEFDKESSHYFLNVLRLKPQEEIILFNGQDGEFKAEFIPLKKIAHAKIMSFAAINREPSFALHLGQAIARGDRMDLVIQKATELGVSEITPLLTRKCNIKLDEVNSPKKMQHWQRIIISACEQSGRTALPLLHPPRPLTDWAAQPFSGCSLLFDLNGSQSLKNISKPTAIRLAIGPESGWTSEENSLLLTKGFEACTLGPRVLRTETAGLAAISILQGLFGDV